MRNKFIILLLVILALGALVIISSVGAVRPWAVSRSDQPVTMVDPSDPTQIPIYTMPTVTPVSPVGSIYRDEAASFELTYPVDWMLIPSKPLGSRASQALLLSPGTTAESLGDGGTRISIVIYNCDPMGDLSAYVTKRKAAWNASGSTILEETELELAGGHQAVSFIVESTDKQRDFIMITTTKEKYLEIAGQGNLAWIKEIAQTLSPLDAGSQDYQSENGHFSIQYPSTAIFYEDQQVSADGVVSPAENTIAIQDTSNNGSVLSITYYNLPDDTSLSDFVRKESDCLELSSLAGQLFSIQGHASLLFPDTNCGVYGTTFIYTIAGNMGYRFTLETHKNYSATEHFIDPILKSFQAQYKDMPRNATPLP